MRQSGTRASSVPILFLAGAWLLSFLAAVRPVFAAATLPYAVRAWTIEDGLPTSTVQDIAQTPDGYLWLSTTGGLARFDGVRFESFGLADSLPTNRFQGLAVDRTGALWISAEDGNLIRWDGRAFTHQPTGTLWAASAMAVLPDGRILGASHDGYWARERGVAPLRPAVDSTTAAVVDAHGAVWLTLTSGTPARLAGETVAPIGPAGHLGDRWIVDQRSGAARFIRSRGVDAELLDTQLERVAWLP